MARAVCERVAIEKIARGRAAETFKSRNTHARAGMKTRPAHSI
jgi:hypothetical protein